MVGSEVVNLPPENLSPEFFADELHYVQLILKAGRVPGKPGESNHHLRHWGQQGGVIYTRRVCHTQPHTGVPLNESLSHSEAHALQDRHADSSVLHTQRESERMRQVIYLAGQQHHSFISLVSTIELSYLAIMVSFVLKHGNVKEMAKIIQVIDWSMYLLNRPWCSSLHCWIVGPWKHETPSPCGETQREPHLPCLTHTQKHTTKQRHSIEVKKQLLNMKKSSINVKQPDAASDS